MPNHSANPPGGKVDRWKTLAWNGFPTNPPFHRAAAADIPTDTAGIERMENNNRIYMARKKVQNSLRNLDFVS